MDDVGSDRGRPTQNHRVLYFGRHQQEQRAVDLRGRIARVVHRALCDLSAEMGYDGDSRTYTRLHSSRRSGNDEWEPTQRRIQGVLPHPNDGSERGRLLEGC
jgi:hypothetical protein